MQLESTSSINTLNSASTTSAASTASSSTLDSDGFMQLLLAQLRNQNPLDPMQDKDMMAQFTQLNSLSELQKIGNILDSMTSSNELGNAANLIGKTVKVAGSQGDEISGVVTGVSFSGGNVMLALDDQLVPLSSLISVSETDPGGK
jgi:flagellar basal-body rod modification protein FlgD